MIDFSTPHGTRAVDRLTKETVAWLTTVGADGTPQPIPVWFLWEGETVLIYSQPNKPKVRNIERRPQVSLNLDGDGHGGNIIVLTGEARLDSATPPGDQHPAYLAKYGDDITRIGMTPQSFAADYSVPIRFAPTKLRGH